jgi:hypothetical protein
MPGVRGLAMAPTSDGGLPELLGRLTDDSLDKRDRLRLLTRLVPLVARQAGAPGAAAGSRGPRQIGDVVVDLVTETAPRLPVRDLATLRKHHGDRTGDALATALITVASKATAAVGAAGGALATVQFTAPPTLLSAPVQLAAETAAVVAIEVKLVAELHEVYGVIVPGNALARGGAWMAAWAQRRGIDLSATGRGLTSVVGTAARRQLRGRLARRAGRNAASMMPLMLGAAAAAELNRRETRKLGEQISADLRPGGRGRSSWYDGWRR